MVTLFTAVTLGIVFAIFATQNTSSVTLNFGNYILPSMPIYLVVLIPLLIGLLLALFFHINKDLSQGLTINEQKDEIKNLKKSLAEITKSAHQLEIENAKLKNENGTVEDENAI